ncbi:unnamed protein product [Clonostachys byssicola]|uniref:Uncharacterized protein n=1 Tax=Clonostachys byssicola TaxID=160290 RepID=A0A9N9UTA7_9HYPO|nr:unnamed protein product [Clonostachys byssicola]
MLWCWTVSLILRPAVAHPQAATTTGPPCRKDEIYTSLMREDDGEFCQSLMNDHCVTVSTPEAYTSLGDDEISSYRLLEHAFRHSELGARFDGVKPSFRDRFGDYGICFLFKRR